MSYRDIFSRFINFHRAIRYLLCFFPRFPLKSLVSRQKRMKRSANPLDPSLSVSIKRRIRPRDIYGRLSIKFDELTFSALEYLSNAI